MNAPPDSPLLALLRQVRRRLWSERILFRLLRATWWSATLLLGGGLIHALRHPLPWSAVATLASLPLMAAVLLGLLRDRPPLAYAAAITDHWFDGKALMSSALDQWQEPQGRHTRASRFVIEAAERCAPFWIERLARKQRWRPPHHTVIPVALGLAGVYLLLLPGPAPRGYATDTAAIPGPATPDTPRRDDTASDFVASLRKALREREPTDPAVMTSGAAPHDTQQSDTDRVDALHSGGTESAFSPDTHLSRAGSILHERETPTTTDERGSAATGSDGPVSNTAGSGAGQPAEARDRRPAAPPLNVQYFPVGRQVGGNDVRAAPGRGAGRTLTPVPAALVPAAAPQAARAARWDTDMPYATSLSAAQRHYVRQYFSNLGEFR